MTLENTVWDTKFLELQPINHFSKAKRWSSDPKKLFRAR